MYSLGIDLGTSSVKVSLFDIKTGNTGGSAHYPREEMGISSLHPGWAEQSPEDWWQNTKLALREVISQTKISPSDIECMGISYQMHGLVLVDEVGEVVRPSIIWCDSRAVKTGALAFDKLGQDYCLRQLLNSPGNFTAAKLGWVIQSEPEQFQKAWRFMLPGDFIAYKLTGAFTTTPSGLSEGVFWNFEKRGVSERLLDYFDIPKSMIPEVVPTFQDQVKTSANTEAELGIKAGTPVSYRAGDQPNNAFSLNVLNPGEVAATAGTSGVIYAVTDQNLIDEHQRLNTFLHVNDTAEKPSNGMLLCINGSGSLNRWIRTNMASESTPYEEMNQQAASVPIGADGLRFYPFGNGAERMANNQELSAGLMNIDFNRHGRAHLFRAGQEGIVFALKYGFDLLEKLGCASRKIRAGKANMFLSPLFREAFSNTIGTEVQLFDTDGAEGAARGAALGAGIYQDYEETFASLRQLEVISPKAGLAQQYEAAYLAWKEIFEQKLLAPNRSS